MIDKQTFKRLNRGLTGFSSRMMRITNFFQNHETGEYLWVIESRMSSKTPNIYTVTFNLSLSPWPEAWECTCPDYQKRHRPCKHILAVQVYYQQRIDA